FSYLPSISAEDEDGIVIDPRALGTMGSAQAPYANGRTLVHEMGHYFGLRHLWGNEEGSCTNTDYMKDTPWQREANFGCSDFPSVSCPSEKNGDMFMNFMDYSNDTCSLLFTKNQVEFMQLILRTSKVTLLHSKAVTGLDEKSSTPQLHVYPNPTSDVFYVELVSNKTPTQFTITDALGRIIKTGTIDQSRIQID